MCGTTGNGEVKLPEARQLESISRTAAQAGRLRPWMTTEPAVSDCTKAMVPQPWGFRMHVQPSQVAETGRGTRIRAGGAKAWVVSEAGTGVIRAVVDARFRMFQQIVGMAARN